MSLLFVLLKFAQVIPESTSYLDKFGGSEHRVIHVVANQKEEGHQPTRLVYDFTTFQFRQDRHGRP